MKFAIRDDDISYWTKPEEIEAIYKGLWQKGIKVSFSVIPFAVQSFNMGDFNNFYQDDKPMPLHENKELIDYLKEKLNLGKISIMLHGYTHEYRIKYRNKLLLPTKENLELIKKNTKKINWVGEYAWKTYDEMFKETKIGKEYLEDIFHTKVSVFVPPSNDISANGVKAVVDNGLNISGIIMLRRFNRKFNYYSLRNWIKKAVYKIFNGYEYPFVMDYKTHKELLAYGLVPGVSIDRLIKQYKFCKKQSAPFVLSVHYWELLNCYQLLNIFEHFIQYIYKKGVSPVILDNIFLEYEK
ncbi:MAG: DUF2334 domain-containing protein [Candidatus Aenigmatarchaeota archaeon]